jgi:hypothetical protein
MRCAWRLRGRWRASERQQAWSGRSAGGRNGAQACACKPAIGWAGLFHVGVALGQFQNRAGLH